MENEDKRFESVYSTKVRAGRRRTYFFDVRQTKGEDYYITLTESTRKFNGDGYERHKIFLYKEDFNRFVESLQDAVSHVKNELMPDYDYEEYSKRQEEWEAEQALISANGAAAVEGKREEKVEEMTEEKDEEISESSTGNEVEMPVADEVSEAFDDVADAVEKPATESSESDVDEDMSW